MLPSTCLHKIVDAVIISNIYHWLLAHNYNRRDVTLSLLIMEWKTIKQNPEFASQRDKIYIHMVHVLCERKCEEAEWWMGIMASSLLFSCLSKYQLGSPRRQQVVLWCVMRRRDAFGVKRSIFRASTMAKTQILYISLAGRRRRRCCSSHMELAHIPDNGRITYKHIYLYI